MRRIATAGMLGLLLASCGVPEQGAQIVKRDASDVAALDVSMSDASTLGVTTSDVSDLSTPGAGPKPIISKLSAKTARAAGGGVLWLYGEHLEGVNVRIGTTLAPQHFRPAHTPGALGALVPAGVPGPVDITIDGKAGATAVLPGALTYVSKATVTCIEPPVLFTLDTKALTYKGPKAPEVVQLAGMFTGWLEGALPMLDDGTQGDKVASDGVFSRVVAMREGTTEYKFVVDGTWMADPGNPAINPLHGNSVFAYSDPCTPKLKVDSPPFGAVITTPLVKLEATVHKAPAPETPIVGASIVLLVDDTPAPILVDEAAETVTAAIAFDDTTREGRHRWSLHAMDQADEPAEDRRGEFVLHTQNRPPVAHAGFLKFGRAGVQALLDGTLSRDPDALEIAEWKWSWVSTPMATGPAFDPAHVTDWKGYQFAPDLEPPKSPSRVWVVPAKEGVYDASLAVTDSDGASGTPSVGRLVVLPKDQPGASIGRPRVRIESVVPGGSLRAVATLENPNEPISPPDTNTWTWYQDARNPQQIDLESRIEDGGKALRLDGLPADGDSFFAVVASNGKAWSEEASVLVRHPGAWPIAYALDEPPDWLRQTTLYEVFVRQWADGHAPATAPSLLPVRVTNDGTGDLRGLREKLPYVTSLGVGTLWLMPMFASADRSHGYHVIDYERVEPDYGDDADLKALCDSAHAAGLRVMVDWVINHSSRFHPWFLESLDPKSRFRDRYIWFNNGKYGYGRETYGQKLEIDLGWADIPDLNLAEPEVFHHVLGAAQRWMDMGVDGFRLDHVTGPDHAFWRAFRKEMKRRKPDVALIAEAWNDMPVLVDYAHGEFDCAFNFPHFYTATAIVKDGKPASDLGDLLAKMEKSFPAGALHCPFSSNHDVPWKSTLWKDLGQDSAKMGAIANLLLTAPGAPQILYGDEVGSTEHRGPMPWNLVGETNALQKIWSERYAARSLSTALRAGETLAGASDAPTDVAVFARKADAEVVVATLNLHGVAHDRVMTTFSALNLLIPGTAYRLVDLLTAETFPVDEDGGVILLDLAPWQGRWLRLDAMPGPDPMIALALEVDVGNADKPPTAGQLVHVTGEKTWLGAWATNVVPLYDDGTHGDLKAADGVWTRTFDVPLGVVSEFKYLIDLPGAQSWSGAEWSGDAPNRKLYAADVDGDLKMRLRASFGVPGMAMQEP